jgi:hypothetical protein
MTTDLYVRSRAPLDDRRRLGSADDSVGVQELVSRAIQVDDAKRRLSRSRQPVDGEESEELHGSGEHTDVSGT